MVLVFVFESFSLLVAPVSGCCSVKMSDGLGRSWDGLGQSLGGLWAVLGCLGAVSERSWGDLGAVLCGLGAVLWILGRSGAKMLLFHWF